MAGKVCFYLLIAWHCVPTGYIIQRYYSYFLHLPKAPPLHGSPREEAMEGDLLSLLFLSWRSMEYSLAIITNAAGSTTLFITSTLKAKTLAQT